MGHNPVMMDSSPLGRVGEITRNVMTAVNSSEPFRLLLDWPGQVSAHENSAHGRTTLHVYSQVSRQHPQRRNPASLPPICRLPGTKRLLWRIEDVEGWIAQYIHVNQSRPTDAVISDEVKPKRGRLTKAEQVARQCQQAKASRTGRVDAAAGA